MKKKIVAEANVYRIETNLDLSHIRFNGKDYINADLEKSIRVKSRNELIAVVLHNYFSEGKVGQLQGVVFCVNTNHAQEMERVLNTNGLSAKAYTRKTKNPDEVMQQFREKKTRFLCACEMISEGWDYPELGILVMARPTLSKVLYMQQIGRGLRRTNTKTNVFVIDVVDEYGAMAKPCSMHSIFSNPFYTAFGSILKRDYSVGDMIEGGTAMKHKFWSFRFWLHRSHLYITLGIFLFSFLVIYIPLNTSFFDPVTRAFEDFRLSDLFLRLSDRNSMPESNEIFVVDVTSIRNRKAIAETIAEVAATSPKVIALDIMFPDDDRSEDNLILMQTLDTIPATIVTASEISDDNSVLSSFFTPALPQLREGYTNTTMNNTYSKCLRTYTTTVTNEDDTLRSLPLQIALAYQPSLRYEKDAEQLINYSDVHIRKVLPTDISLFADRFKDKIVVIGIASGKEDLHLTPVGDLSGPEIVALSAHTLIHHREITEMPVWLGVVLGFLLTYCFVVTCSYLHIKYEKTDNIRITLSAILVTILLVFINLIVNHFFHYSISLIYAFTGIVLTGNALSFYVGWLLWLQEKKKLKHPEKTLYL